MTQVKKKITLIRQALWVVKHVPQYDLCNCISQTKTWLGHKFEYTYDRDRKNDDTCKIASIGSLTCTMYRDLIYVMISLAKNTNSSTYMTEVEKYAVVKRAVS